MNSLRNFFSSRTLNYLRQNGQNALINITQPVDNAAPTNPPTGAEVKKIDQNRPKEPLLIPKTILDATIFTGKKLPACSSGSISPTTLKQYRRMSRKIDIVYRCKICNTRNSKKVSEEAYKSGVVILQCDGCSVNHLIIDNVGWFTNTKGKTFDEVLAENSNSVKVIRVNEKGELI
ncbi:DNL-type zinc finger protein [Musca domestica]|uniref:DNL zinc finger n=1 Tax=Musca domestica TaxID=7370 RepID=T1PBX8_MUSDO|nr:DNL-type zinc finger protein [Musca domestica]